MLDAVFAFDRPLFKRLAHNDTGQAVGHQAGVLIPAAMDSYFPQLGATASAANPAPSLDITADLFDGAAYLGQVTTRYQYQTWGGTRSPERRITGNLTSLRDLAQAHDVLVIERGISDPNRYRLTLIRQGTSAFATLSTRLGNRRFGPVETFDPPSSELETEQALAQITAQEQQPFEPFEASANVVESKTKKVARSRAFQVRLLELYGPKCAVCGGGLSHPKGTIEVEAAHIVPRGLKGADDPRNGLMLCRQHHWAFDYGLFGLDNQHRVIVPTAALALPTNGVLAQYRGKQIRLPQPADLRPSAVSLSWHRTNVLIG
jgi:putative restriction endonuclease